MRREVFGVHNPESLLPRFNFPFFLLSPLDHSILHNIYPTLYFLNALLVCFFLLIPDSHFARARPIENINAGLGKNSD